MTAFEAAADIQSAWIEECRRSSSCPDPIWKDETVGPISRFFKTPGDVAAEIVVSAVDPSTIRSFRNTLTYRPLSLFRAWAHRQLTQDGTLRKHLSAVNADADDFRDFHAWTCQSLREFWKKKDGTTPTFAQSRKLVDLFVKFLVNWADLSNDARRGLYANANVPLDKYSLGAISTLWNQQATKRTRIPNNASMGWTTRNKYWGIQEFIRETMNGVNTVGIEFDIIAWHRARVDETRFRLKRKKVNLKGKKANRV